MLIIAITELTKKKVKVEFEDQFTLVLYKGELKLFHLKEGIDIADSLIEEIETKVLKKRAIKYAMHLLQKKDYTQKELIDKLLHAGHTANCAQQALEYVSSYGYVDDVRYAVRYLETYSDRKSLRRMQMDLWQKGISDEIFALAKEEAETTDETDTLRYFAQKKATSLDLSQEKDRQKFLRFLVGKGFSYSAAKEMLDELKLVQCEEGWE